jgi:choline dehydrogenase-like flavoprotein
MIEDARALAPGTVLDCDLCIVGGGAAGITLALQFLRGGARVLLLESGGLLADEATQNLYAAEIADPALHAPGERYRARRLGGSTTIWGGRCVPFDPLDFAPRPWIGDHAWPIGHDEVARHYPAANAICEAGECIYDAREAVPGGMRPLIGDFRPAHFDTDGIERFSCPTDFADRYRHRLAASRQVRVLLNANCTELLSDELGRRIERLRVRTLTGVAFAVTAGVVILAAGGLEIPRLLLASRSRHPGGIGNATDQVGRHYMCHIAATLGTLRLDVPRGEVAHGYAIAEDGTYCRRRLALTPAAQQRLGLASAVLRLHFPAIPDPRHRTGPLSALYLARPFISYEYAKRLTGGPGGAGLWLRHVANVALDPFATAGFLLHWLRHRSLAARKFPSVVVRPKTNVFSLDYHAEQVPNPASRVTLSRDTDRLGMPKLRIDWRYSALDVRTAAETLRLLREDVAAWGRGALDYDPETIEQQIVRDGAYGGHHIGTARMGRDPATSVVDGDCRVHGMENLYVAGSAVFASSSQANPTLSIVALALRLAAHVGATLARSESLAAPVRAAAQPARETAAAVQEPVSVAALLRRSPVPDRTGLAAAPQAAFTQAAASASAAAGGVRTNPSSASARR